MVVLVPREKVAGGTDPEEAPMLSVRGTGHNGREDQRSGREASLRPRLVMGTPVLKVSDHVALPLTKRFRVKGGTLTHAAAIVTDDDGFTAILACDVETGRWWRKDEAERLGLRQPSDADITCSECQKILDRVQERGGSNMI